VEKKDRIVKLPGGPSGELNKKSDTLPVHERRREAGTRGGKKAGAKQRQSKPDGMLKGGMSGWPQVAGRRKRILT